MEETIGETEAYFKELNKSFDKHWNQCITLEGHYVNELNNEFCLKNCLAINDATNLLSDMLKLDMIFDFGKQFVIKILQIA